MNTASDLFLLLLNLSQMRSRSKIVDLFMGSVSELFAPRIFQYTERDPDAALLSFRIATRNSAYGHIVWEEAEPLSSEEHTLLLNAVQMLAVVLERLSFEEKLEKERASIEGVADERLVNLQVAVEQLQQSRNAYIDLVEELTREIDERKRAEAALQYKSSLLEAQTDSTIDGILIVDSQGKKILQNKRAIALLKIPRPIADEVDDAMQLQYVARQTKYPDRFLEKVSYLYNHADERSQDEVEFSDGTVLDRYSAPVLGTDGQYYGRIWVFRDITERKQAESALTQAHNRMRRFVDSNIVGVIIASAAGCVLEANDYYLRMIGYTREEFEQGMVDWRAATPPEWIPADDHAIREMRERGTCTPYEKEYVRRDGTRVSVFLSDAMLPGPEEQIAAFCLDITARKQAEAARLESEKRYRELFTGSRDGIVVVGERGQFLDANPAYCALLGYSVEEFLAMSSYLDVTPQRWHAWEHEEIWNRRLMREGYSGIYEKEYIRKDGSIFPAELQAFAVFDASGMPQYVWGVARDITERKRAAELLQESEAQKKAILNGITANIALVDREQKILWVNKTAAASANRSPEDMLGHPCYLYWGNSVEPCVNCPTVKAFQTRRSEHTIVQTPDGRIWDEGAEPVFDEEGNVAAVVEIAQDITDRKRAEAEKERLEAQLQQAQKMEAVGQLAGGVAHDFNNLLQVIMANMEILENEIMPGTPAREWAEEVSKAAQRAAELTRQLLVFSRRQIIQPVNFDLNDLIQSVLKMIRRVIGEHIRLHFVPGNCLSAVFADKGQIEQILMNLCVNARDAMTQGGTLTIETKNVSMDAEYCRDHQWTAEGRYVLVSVADTGHGMDAETCAHIFEPFFTTKGVGEGTGLGLATVYGIVKQHKGAVQVYSEPGAGTVFKVYLPAVEYAAQESDAQAAESIAGGAETILIAEDEPAVMKMLAMILRTAGYTVLTAADGHEALRVFEENRGVIDLVILDVMMPGLGGRQVMDRIQAKYDGVRFLFSSGYSEHAIHTDFVIQEGLRLIQKPYSKNDLLRAVRQSLDADAAEGPAK